VKKEAIASRPSPEPLEAGPAPVLPRRAFLGIPPRVLTVVGTFLVLTLIGAYFLFKGPRTRTSQPQAAPAGSLAHARQLMSRGKMVEARAELRRVPSGDPDSGEAQRLLEELSKPGGAEASSGAGGGADPARLRSAGEAALGEKRYIDALKNFGLAAAAYRNDPSFAQEQALASEKVAALTPAVKLYNEGEYETAIPILWRLVQEDRDNRDARSYLLRAYYNQGITQLQNGLYPKAVQAFQEALSLDPNDAEAARHKRFATRYQKADLDLMGRIYVRHLNHRP
jgi:tetratricopeptide (TPR) repeat protein